MQRLAVLVDHIDGADGNRGDFEVAFGVDFQPAASTPSRRILKGEGFTDAAASGNYFTTPVAMVGSSAKRSLIARRFDDPGARASLGGLPIGCLDAPLPLSPADDELRLLREPARSIMDRDHTPLAPTYRDGFGCIF
jgi:hypothetical protein